VDIIYFEIGLAQKQIGSKAARDDRSGRAPQNISRLE